MEELYANSQPEVLGAAGFYDEKWFNTFLQVSGPGIVDGLTHHIYNLGAGIYFLFIYLYYIYIYNVYICVFLYIYVCENVGHRRHKGTLKIST